MDPQHLAIEWLALAVARGAEPRDIALAVGIMWEAETKAGRWPEVSAGVSLGSAIRAAAAERIRSIKAGEGD